MKPQHTTSKSNKTKRPMMLMPAHFMIDELRHRGYTIIEPSAPKETTQTAK